MLLRLSSSWRGVQVQQKGVEMQMKTEIVNRAIYVDKKTSAKDYVPICAYCKKFESCDEPNKNLRITCPNDVYMSDESTYKEM